MGWGVRLRATCEGRGGGLHCAAPIYPQALTITTSASPTNLSRKTSATPRVWLLEPYRTGEQQQVLALAEALGWPFETKHLHYRTLAFGTNLLRGSSLRGIDRRRSAALAAPWPDLVISAGMRNEPVGRWIRRQSGGRCRIVHVGRPWADPRRFDLVITTPQYRLPRRANVLHNDLPLHRVEAARLREAAARWRDALAQLPAPRIAVILGGDSGPFTLGAKAARRLADAATALARQRGGSLLITTSPRTADAATRLFAGDLGVPTHFYAWQPGAADNPYFGYLALADAFVVTADSVSMLSEACATGKPLYLFDLGTGRHSMRAGCGGAGADVRADPDGNDFRLSGLLYRALMRWGWQRLSRDITLIHRQLVASGRAVWLGNPDPHWQSDAGGDVARAVARVRALFDLDG
ncbi:MAG: nucleoside-diphosphate sugar epimerase [Porticoccaceae bacterium]|nr:MAG: nucleoside-diphosphate sugar epimerase [Porticoccaceae bacterium]